MENQKKCIIWGTDVSSIKDDIKAPNDHKHIFDSPRAGGKYIIEHQTYLATSKNGLSLSNEKKIRLAGYIAKKNLLGKTPSLDSIMESENWLEKLPLIPNASERAYLLLEGFVKKTNAIGEQFYTSDLFNSLPEYIVGSINEKYAKTRMYPYLFLYALSYCEKEDEMRFLLNYLIELNFIGHYGDLDFFQVTVKGFEKINRLSKSVNSKKAFIAMWINSSMDNLKNCIETAVKNTGYEPLRIDDKEHNNKIDDEILNEIKKTRFIVCDLTSEEGKPRGSVYFEAGYAMGKGIPIVWTCKKDLEKELPFDIRQYNCLYWEKEKLNDFIKKLQHRIENTVGKGPLKGV